jgi:hypothetical protein
VHREHRDLSRGQVLYNADRAVLLFRALNVLYTFLHHSTAPCPLYIYVYIYIYIHKYIYVWSSTFSFERN